MRIYMVIYEYDQQLLSLKSEWRAQHRAFTRKLEKEGVILSTGRTHRFERDGSLTIMRADSAKDAEAILADDPYVQAGLVTKIDSMRWYPIVGETFGNEA